MKSSSLVRPALALGAFAVSAFASFLSAGSGGSMMSLPYAARDAGIDAALARVTLPSGNGAQVLDGIVSKWKAKSEAK
jgi:hypothetical protein